MPLMFWGKKKTSAAAAQTEPEKAYEPTHGLDEPCTCTGDAACSVECALRKTTASLDAEIARKRQLRQKVREVAKEIEEADTTPFLTPVPHS